MEEEETVTLRAQVFYSEIFLKQEKDKRRVLHDLKLSGANNHVRQNAVKQEGVAVLKSMIRPGGRFAMWGLPKAFFQVTVQQHMRPMLRTVVMLPSPTGEWQPRRLQNATLSMGLRVAPEIMTKMFVPILNLLRQLGMRVAMKVDDLVAVLPHAVDQAMMQTAVITQLLVKLGAVMSPNKCEFGMRMRVEWHGMIFCMLLET